MTALIAALPRPIISFFWLVRREFWEHRLVLLSPMGVGALVLVGFVIGLPFGIFAGLVEPQHQKNTLLWALNVSTFFSLVTGLAAAVFYCLEALHGERRDRSILFFKSLPVSDARTVLAKLFVPAALLPVTVFVAALMTNLALLVVATGVLAVSGHSVGSLLSFGVSALRPSCLVYALLLSMPWYLPLYCALLAISAWAKHAPLLWAGLPLVLAVALDRLAIHSGRVTAFLLYRVTGWVEEGLRFDAAGQPVGRTLDRYLAAPGLWLGLAVAAALFAAAVHLRRRATPI